MLDGGLHEDPYTEVANVAPNPDAIQEFSFQTNNYSAKFGGRGGGVVNMVTKSGTNDFHGSLFEYVRNSTMNARNFFAATRRRIEAQPVRSLRRRAGHQEPDLLLLLVAGNATPPASAHFHTIVPTRGAAAGRFFQHAPRTQLIDPVTKQPIPGNIIPASQLDPVAQKVLQTIPLPNQPGGLLYYVQASSQTDNQYIGRIDHQFTHNHRLSGRYFFDGLDNPGIIDLQNRLTNIPEQALGQPELST